MANLLPILIVGAGAFYFGKKKASTKKKVILPDPPNYAQVWSDDDDDQYSQKAMELVESWISGGFSGAIVVGSSLINDSMEDSLKNEMRRIASNNPDFIFVFTEAKSAAYLDSFSKKYNGKDWGGYLDQVSGIEIFASKDRETWQRFDIPEQSNLVSDAKSRISSILKSIRS